MNSVKTFQTTKEKLESYIYLERYIISLQKKIDHMEANPPDVSHGKVKGSAKNFPYTEQHFLVSAPDGFKTYKKWRDKINDLYNEYVAKKREAIKIKIDVEEFINGITDMSTQLIFTYTYLDGMSQEEVALNVGLTQSAVSKRITGYLNTVDMF